MGGSGRGKGNRDYGGSPFSVVVGVGAAHPEERGSGVVPLGNDGAEIVVDGVARDRSPRPFTGPLLACTAKQFVVSAVVRLTDEWGAAHRIGVGRNVNGVGILGIEGAQTRVIVFAGIQARARVSDFLTMPRGAVPARVVIPQVHATLTTRQASAIDLARK